MVHPIRQYAARSGWPAIAMAALTMLAAGEANAQSDLEPGETRVTRGQQPEPESEAESDGDKSNDEATSEAPPDRPGVESFEDVKVKRVRPDVLPPPSASETDIPKVLRNATGNLPAPPSIEQLEKTTERVRSRVYELISIQSPKAPGDGTPIVHRGHAVLVSGAKGPPILVTTYFWVKESEKLYLAPRELSKTPGSDDDKPTAERRSLEEMTVDGRADRWLKKHRDELVRARLYKPDEHRNLATVIPDDVAQMNLPNDGLELFDFEDASPVRLYGYTPKGSSGLSQTKLLASHPDKASLVYYLQTTYSVVFGAPIVSTSGKLVVLTAFKHPEDPDTVLTIPPKPLAAYVDDVLSTL